jgi:protein involved in sex pheromone biosynthesis
MLKRTKFLAPTAIALLLAACGGGGGEAQNNATQTEPAGDQNSAGSGEGIIPGENTMANVSAATENVAEDAGNLAQNAANAVSNAAEGTGNAVQGSASGGNSQ